ncbi:hypothetical protein ACFLXT_02670 [Chloroflexota bacterium]
MKPRLLDLFCGAGGAAKGYHRAGFEIVGVDINPQPRYPFEFHQADALTYPLDGFDAYHASPPCQGYSMNLQGLVTDGKYPMLIDVFRERFHGKVWIIENVVGAPIPPTPTLFGEFGLMLCGTMLGLDRVWRHRLFLSTFAIPRPGKDCNHSHWPLNPYKAPSRKRDGIEKDSLKRYGVAMGIDWMKGREISEAIPPAYTEYIGEYLMKELNKISTNV